MAALGRKRTIRNRPIADIDLRYCVGAAAAASSSAARSAACLFSLTGVSVREPCPVQGFMVTQKAAVIAALADFARIAVDHNDDMLVILQLAAAGSDDVPVPAISPQSRPVL
jgi:hypothetical protein